MGRRKNKTVVCPITGKLGDTETFLEKPEGYFANEIAYEFYLIEIEAKKALENYIHKGFSDDMSAKAEINKYVRMMVKKGYSYRAMCRVLRDKKDIFINAFRRGYFPNKTLKARYIGKIMARYTPEADADEVTFYLRRARAWEEQKLEAYKMANAFNKKRKRGQPAKEFKELQQEAKERTRDISHYL